MTEYFWAAQAILGPYPFSRFAPPRLSTFSRFVPIFFVKNQILGETGVHGLQPLDGCTTKP